MDGHKFKKIELEKSNSLQQTFIKVSEEKLLRWLNKTLNIELFFRQLIVAAITLTVFEKYFFPKIFAIHKNTFAFVSFSHLSLLLFSQKKCEISRKNLQNTNENFFRVTFRSLQTLGRIQLGMEYQEYNLSKGSVQEENISR